MPNQPEPHGGPQGDLAIRFDGLAKALLEDIAHEERELLVSDVIRDVPLVQDHSDG